MTSYPVIPLSVLERWSKMLLLLSELLNVQVSHVLRCGGATGFEVVVRQRYRNDSPEVEPFQWRQEIHQRFCEKVVCERGGFELDDTSLGAQGTSSRASSLESVRDSLVCLGFPIAWPDGTNYGVIDILDDKPRTYSSAQRRLVEQFRDSIEDQLALICAGTWRTERDDHTAVERERLVLATAASGSGVWDYNIDADVLHCDARWHQILGIDPATPVVSLEEFKRHIHPDDAERATEVHATMAELVANQRHYNIVFRVIRPDGEVRWIKSTACLIATDGNSPNRAVGAVVDITEQTLATAALVESELRFKTLAEMLPQGVFSAHPDGSVDYHNRRWCEIVGIAEEAANSASWSALLHPDDLDRAVQAWRHALQAAQRFEIEIRCRQKSGEYRWLQVTAMPVVDDDGRVVRWFGIVADIHVAKLLELSREALAQELDHRIRNLFAIVDGLISLCVRDDPQMALFADRLRRRLTALHRAHTLAVIPGTPVACSLYDLVYTLLDPYQSAEEKRILIEGDDVRIGRTARTPLALIFHELATNASKHGALRAPQGRLCIAFARHDDQLLVKWMETGTQGGNVAEREGFGSKLLNLLIDVQLGGKLSTQWTEQGMLIELCLPLHVIERREDLRGEFEFIA